MISTLFSSSNASLLNDIISPAMQSLKTHANFLLHEINPASSRDRIFAKIINITQETHDTKTYTLKPPKHWGSFTAGMHMAVFFVVNGQRVERTYSLSSPPAQLHNQQSISFTAKCVNDGLVSNALFYYAREGDWIEIGKASGEFTQSHANQVNPTLNKDKDSLFIAAGSGITPIYSMLNDQLNKNSLEKATLLYFCRKDSDIIFKQQLAQLANSKQNFQLHIFLSEQQEKISTDIISKYCENLSNQAIYLCGPYGFMETAKNLLSANFAIENEHIHQEFFGARSILAHTTTNTEQNTTQQQAIPVTLKKSQATIESDGSMTLLELAESTGATPKHGCRAGRCHQCKTMKHSGVTKDLRTGKLSFDAEEIQPCVCIAIDEVTIDL